MTKFIVREDFWELFPEAQFGVVLAKNIDNHGESGSEIKKLLLDANAASEKFTTEAVFSENPSIAVWRAAYQKFKTKKGARASVENLLKRVSKGNEVRSINKLVDIYNAISLTYGLPAGGEDLDSFAGNLELKIAQGGENFLAIGEEKPEPCLPGEVAYLDEAGAVCRGWNWRDGQRTMLTEDTQNAFLIVESCLAEQRATVIEASQKLSDLVDQYFKTSTKVELVDKEHKEMEL